MISSEHPFVPPEGDRDPVRRLRGRLAAPVTIATAGAGAERTGLTVSSLFVLDGEPARLQAVIGPLTDLWATIEDTGRFVVHVCASRHAGLADVFAGLRPNPGGPFAGSSADESEWGPVLGDLPDRAYCRVEEMRQVGYTGVVTAVIDRVEVSGITDPLIHFRGGYRRLD